MKRIIFILLCTPFSLIGQTNNPTPTKFSTYLGLPTTNTPSISLAGGINYFPSTNKIGYHNNTSYIFVASENFVQTGFVPLSEIAGNNYIRKQLTNLTTSGQADAYTGNVVSTANMASTGLVYDSSLISFGGTGTSDTQIAANIGGTPAISFRTKIAATGVWQSWTRLANLSDVNLQNVTTAGNTTTTGATFGGTVGVATPTASTHATTKLYVDNADALKANLASPVFTGAPSAPTATAGTSTTQLATTAFVDNNYVTLTTAQTFSGNKTISGLTKFNRPSGSDSFVQQVAGVDKYAIGVAAGTGTPWYLYDIGSGVNVIQYNNNSGAPATQFTGKVQTVTPPTGSSDLTNKQYVDGAIAAAQTQIVDVAGTSQVLAPGNTYIFHNSSTAITASLPVTNPTANGGLITIIVDGSGRVKITQNASQYIVSGSSTSTVGTAGFVQTSTNNATITLRYVNTNKWLVSSSNSTPTIN